MATASTPTVVLVHGAFADASGFGGVIRELQSAGHAVLAPPNPLRSLAFDAAAIAALVAAIDGPVVLVGHSYGGAVITQASAGADNVTAVVYLAAFERAEKTNRNARRASNLHQRKIALLAKAAKSLAGRENTFCGDGHNALALQNVHDGGWIQAARAAKKDGALKKAHVRSAVKAVTAARALGNDEAERLPCTQSRGRDADAACDFADAEEWLRIFPR